MNFNRVILGGHLTRDPELKDGENGSKIVNFGVASNRIWNNKEGEKQEETCFVNCVAFGKMGANIDRFFTKGRPILLEGRLRFEKWEDKEGKSRNTLRVVVEKFEFVDKRKSEDETVASQNGPGEIFDTI